MGTGGAALSIAGRTALAVMRVGVVIAALVGALAHALPRTSAGAELGVAVAPSALAAPAVSVVPSVPSGQPVGTRVVWTATATEMGSAPVYKFVVRNSSGGLALAMRDFSPLTTFEWLPLDEGTYTIQVSAKTGFGTATTVSTAAAYQVLSRVSGGTAVVVPTMHPLVALYSAPPCAAGQETTVQFRAVSAQVWQSTHTRSCVPGASMNFLVAGMRANTQHVMRHVVIDGSTMTISPNSIFTTGSPQVPFPTFTLRDDIGPATSVMDDILLHLMFYVPVGVQFPIATDLSGQVLWYYNRSENKGLIGTRGLPGGRFLVIVQVAPGVGGILREVDLTGVAIRETSLERVNEQLVALGKDRVTGFHHELVRFSNGHTLVLGYVERIYNDVQGVSGPVDILGNEIIDLDQDWQVSWVWNAFDHLDINRRSILGEPCGTGFLCPPLYLAPVANDWLHSNTIAYSPLDKSLILSLRHQDWVIKIDYQDSAGSGNVIWRLGKDGDFALVDPFGDAYPWFAHQHDVRYVSPTELAIYDNGNTRCVRRPPNCNSRGQVLRLDEVTRVATLTLNADLGSYSVALGSAERLSNGNYNFTSGFISPGPNSQSIEVLPNASVEYVLESVGAQYRSYRMPSLYEP